MLLLRGATGEIRWSYLTAAAFGPWHLEADRDGATLSARLVSLDDYRFQQTPLTARLHVGREQVTYPILTVTVSGDSVQARLGPREDK